MKNKITTPIYDKNGVFLRQNYSFVCRSGRVTSSQLKSIHDNWSLFGVDFALEPLNFLSLFKRYAPVILEIGFGSGESLVQTAITYPEKNFLGIEVYQSGIGMCLRNIKLHRINNLKVIYYNAVEVIDKMILNSTLFKVQIFFPDPWNKNKHHKRRMVQDYFLRKISQKLVIGGILHIVTDSKEYAYYILNIIHGIKNYVKLSKKSILFRNHIFRITTKFERKAQCIGNQIFDLVFTLKQ